MRTLRSLATILLSGCAWAAFAQAQEPKSRDRVEILNADRWEYDKELATGAQRLIGNVRFRQDDALMACDSAYLYEDER
ncbi:MAG: hypothetical protein KDC01_06395, partial [Flavobacteriales bacterium]|nr:hypothetical protein [Flavobacteriales bacterium]